MLEGVMEGLSMSIVVIQSVGALRREFSASLTTIKILFSVGFIMPCSNKCHVNTPLSCYHPMIAR